VDVPAGLFFPTFREGFTMSTARARVWFPAVLVIVAAVAAASAQADETLRWKFSKGEKLHYLVTQKTSSKAEVAGQKIDTLMTQDIETTWEVQDVDSSGAAVMDQTIERIVFAMTGPGGEIKIDTKKDEKVEGPAASVAPLFKALAGNPCRLKMSARGEVSDVSIPAKLVEALKNAGPAAANNPLFTEEGFKRMLTQASLVLPDGAVAKGQTWKVTKSIPMAMIGTMVMDNVYTYEGPSDPADRISVAVKLDIQPKDGVPFEIKVTAQDSKGAFRFDRKAGVLRGSDLTQKMEMRITTNGQVILQNVDTATKMEQTQTTTPAPK
jgi:hypothetical protein